MGSCFQDDGWGEAFRVMRVGFVDLFPRSLYPRHPGIAVSDIRDLCMGWYQILNSLAGLQACRLAGLQAFRMTDGGGFQDDGWGTAFRVMRDGFVGLFPRSLDRRHPGIAVGDIRDLCMGWHQILNSLAVFQDDGWGGAFRMQLRSRFQSDAWMNGFNDDGESALASRFPEAEP